MKSILMKMFGDTSNKSASRFFSNENDNAITYSRLGSLMELVGMGIKNLSAVPWRYLSEFNGRLPELKELRDASMERGAFL